MHTLAVLVVWVSCAGAGEGVASNVEVTVNGRRAAAGGAGGPIWAGRPNRLTLRALGGAEVGVELVRVQPDGRRGRQRARLTPGTPDVETWCRQRLVDQIQLDPLEDCGGRGGDHDVRPYVELGRRHGVKVFGGVNGNTFWNLPAVLRRAIGLARAGVDGIELYESNNFAATSAVRWLVPLLGNAALAERFLAESNLEACFPTWSRNAAAGFDNHSFRGNWSVEGEGAHSL